MEPITREEYYLAKIAGTYEGNTPEPVTIEEYYLATMAGDYSGNTPQPVTRLQYYMAKVAGVWGGSIPAPVTRLEYYWAAIASGEGKVFPPVTREEHFLVLVADAYSVVLTVVTGNPALLENSKGNRGLESLTLYGKSTQGSAPSPSNPQEIENAGQDGEIRVEVLGKNLLRIDDSLKNYESNDYAGTSKRIIPAGMVAVGLDNVNRFYPDNVSNCVIGNGNITYHTRSAGFAVGIGAKLIPEQTYICSYESTNNGRLCLLYYYDDGTLYETRDFIKSKTKFTIPKNVVYTVLLFRDADVAGDYKFWDIQLESGDVATDYEPYKSQTLIIPTPDGLPGIPVSSGGNYTDEKGQQWVADEIDLAKGERVQRIGKTVVDGGKVKFVASSNSIYWNLPRRTSPGIIDGIAHILSMYFSDETFSGNNTYEFAWTTPAIMKPYFDTSEELNAFCVQKNSEGNPLTIYYRIETPIRTPLSPETIAAYKALRTYSPTTTVINDAEAGMSVGYAKMK